MKWMKKLRLINWHYFTDTTMEFGKQTLITGQNAAGKSTIIDALQVLFVADQRLIRFNAAAHDEAKRSYLNYLKGKIGSDERSFLRDGDFTTYIVSEFIDDDKKEKFVVGVAVDVYRDRSYEEEYFILSDTRLEHLEFVNAKGQLMNRDEFRRRYGLGSSIKQRAIFERNKTSYQKALLARMGHLQDRFFTIFTKALSFKPIQNIRAFVYDYILDRRELKLDLMKQNFEIHERYWAELQRLQERKEQLQGIKEGFEQYSRLVDTVIEQDYVIRRLKADVELENAEQLIREKLSAEQQLVKLQTDIGLAESKAAEARRESQTAYQRWQDNSEEKRNAELTAEISDTANRLEELSKLLSAFKNQLSQEWQLLERFSAWPGNEYWTWEAGEAEELSRSKEELAVLLETAGSGIVSSYEEELWAEKLQAIGQKLSDWYARLLGGQSRLQETLLSTKERIAELERVIRELEQKRRTYSEPVRQLKSLLEASLQGRSSVWIFCEEAELADESWRNALEGYLNTQRFDLLVEPEFFAEALSLYEREKWKFKLEGVGLVDTEKERRYLGTAETGSLAMELQIEHPVIRAHAEHLLGKVMKAVDEQALRHHRTAVTASCMVYNNLVARQIPKHVYDVPYMGAKAIARQLEIRRAELADAKDEAARLAELAEQFQRWSGLLKEKVSLYASFALNLHLPRSHEEQSERLLRKREELSGLNLDEAERLKSEYEVWSEAEKTWTSKWGTLHGEKGGLEEQCKQLAASVFVQERKHQEAEAEWQAWVSEFGPEYEQRAQQRYEEAERQTTPTWQKLQNWTSSWRGQQTLRDGQFMKVVQMRQKYNIDQAFISDMNAADNDEYDKLLATIEHLNIPEYQEKVDAALAESEEEFKSHFVFKLREAIELARREFQQLNHALRHFPFSNDKYHFEVSPSDRYKRFYDAVMDPALMERGSLFDLPENDRSEVLHELFEKLARGEAGDLDEFTDYRQYLDFDIMVTSDNGSRYRFSQVLKEKSGGETQTPFYIAILASFHHLYSSNSSRIVVFDEAFNKMDEQRIQSSLRLIKQMGLQLIAAVPDEKMQHMAPEVSTTLFVSKHNYQIYVDMIDRWESNNDSAVDAGEADGLSHEVVEEAEQSTLF